MMRSHTASSQTWWTILDDVVRAAVRPEIQVAQLAQGIVRVHAGQGDDAQPVAASVLSPAGHVRRPAAGADGDEEVPGVRVELQGLLDPALVAVVVREARQQVRLIEIDAADPRRLGEVDRAMAGDRRAAPVADDNHLAAGGVRVDDQCSQFQELGHDVAIGQRSRVQVEIPAQPLALLSPHSPPPVNATSLARSNSPPRRPRAPHPVSA